MTKPETEADTPWCEPYGGSKIFPGHLERLAMVYVRQSSLQQTLKHQESTRLQYGLVQHAVKLGWPKERIVVIDDDLGRSGSSAQGRPGFQRLVAEVGLGHVGIILGVEMSRLARSCRDWHQMLEVCALFGTLICDLDGLYDLSQYNDRLLLGSRERCPKQSCIFSSNGCCKGSCTRHGAGNWECVLPSVMCAGPRGK